MIYIIIYQSIYMLGISNMLVGDKSVLLLSATRLIMPPNLATLRQSGTLMSSLTLSVSNNQHRTQLNSIQETQNDRDNTIWNTVISGRLCNLLLILISIIYMYTTNCLTIVRKVCVL